MMGTDPFFYGSGSPIPIIFPIPILHSLPDLFPIDDRDPAHHWLHTFNLTL